MQYLGFDFLANNPTYEYCSDSFQVSGMCLVNIVRVRRGNILQTHEARNAWGLYKTKNYAFPLIALPFL